MDVTAWIGCPGDFELVRAGGGGWKWFPYGASISGSMDGAMSAVASPMMLSLQRDFVPIFPDKRWKATSVDQ